MREIEFWERGGNQAPVQAFLLELRRKNENKASKFDACIQFLAKEGDRAINGRDIIKMKFSEIKPPNKIIEIKILPYRLYCLLTSTHLWLLEMIHKKDYKLRKEISRLIIKRAKSILP